MVSRKIRALTRDLGGPEASPSERLLVDRIVLNWLTLYHAEAIYAQRMGQPGGISLDLSTHCQKRYLAAIRALSQLRRVAVTVARVLEPNGRHLEAREWKGDGRCSGVPARPGWTHPHPNSRLRWGRSWTLRMRLPRGVGPEGGAGVRPARRARRAPARSSRPTAPSTNTCVEVSRLLPGSGEHAKLSVTCLGF